MKNDCYAYIKYTLKEKISNNQYDFILSRKQNTGYYITENMETTFEECNITDYLRFNDSYNDIVLEFNQILKDNFEVEYSSSFNKNIKNVKIFDYKLNVFKKFTEIFKESVITGSYDILENEINIKKTKDDDVRDTVMHELLHMSSTKDNMSSGLSQDVMTSRGIKTIGDGINEGMTEYLNRHYFSQKIRLSYVENVRLVEQLQKIVGEDVLIEAYFKKGLPYLIKEMTKYTKDKSKALDIILGMDQLLSSNEIVKLFRENELRKDLASLYEEKLSKQLTEGKISEADYQTRKFLNVDRFIAGDNVYSEDAFVTQGKDTYYIQDGFFRKEVKISSKDNYNFMSEIETKNK